jgi:hypothetical protein
LRSFNELTYYSTLTSTYIRYLHGNGNVVLAITNSGVDVVKIDPQSYRAHTVVSGAMKGFMTADKKFYYTVAGAEWSLNREDSHADWTTPDISYVTGSGIFESGITINDIFITESTGSDGTSNTIFAATSSGVYVIDESDNEYVIYYTESVEEEITTDLWGNNDLWGNGDNWGDNI